MNNKVHLTIHVPGGFIDPLDHFWVAFGYDIGRMTGYDFGIPLRAVEAWRIARALGKSAENAISLSPSKRKYLLILAVNNCYWGGPDGMWEELFDDVSDAA